MIVSKCAICGGKVIQKEISEEIRVGNDFVIVENIKGGVCVECGERYYPPGVVDKLKEIERSLIDKKRLKKLEVMGNTYKIKYSAASTN